MTELNWKSWDLQRFGRNQSLNPELRLANGKVVKPTNMGDFGDQILGSIETSNGEQKYMIPDNIRVAEEIEVTIPIEDDRDDYDKLKEASETQEPQDITVAYRDGLENAVLEFALLNCVVLFGKRSAQDRTGKSVDSRIFRLLPEDIEEV